MFNRRSSLWIVSALVLAGIAVSLWSARVFAVEAALRFALVAQLGVPVSLSVAEVNLQRLVVREARLGDIATARELVISYRLGRLLLARDVERIRIVGLRTTIDPTGGATSGPDSGWNLRAAIFEDTEISLDLGGHGSARFVFDATATASELGGHRLEALGTVEAPQGVQGRYELAAQLAPGFELVGLGFSELVLAADELSGDGWLAEGVAFRLEAEAERQPARLEVQVRDCVEITARSVAIDGGFSAPGVEICVRSADETLVLGCPSWPCDSRGFEADLTGSVHTGAPRINGAPVLARPLDLETTLRWAGGRFSLEVRSRDHAFPAHAELSGADQEIRAASVRLGPFAFDTNGHQPVDVFPVLGHTLPPVSGQLDLVLDRANTGTLQSFVVLNDVSVSADASSVSGLNGALQLGSLNPVTLPEWQLLTFERAAAGTPLGRGIVAFRVQDDQLELRHMGTSWAGGSLNARGQSDLARGTSEFDLEIDRVDLAEVAALANVEGLELEGEIRGSLPITNTPAGLEIHGGKLRAVGPGVIRYRPGESAAGLLSEDPRLDIARRALEDFRFASLEIALSGRTSSEFELGVAVRGHSPKLDTNRPVELNLNVSGHLTPLLKSALAFVELPDRLFSRIAQRWARRSSSPGALK